jgi:ribosomal protein S18 acetylase RimI-like enzyme
MVAIRLMHKVDVDAVRQLEAAAFGAWWRQWGGGSGQRPRRTRTNVLASREKDPEGCFVAEADGNVVGSIFSRTWGAVGWFGNLVVLPAFQGRGLGKQLISASLAYLRRNPGRRIGLETMPESPHNLGLYLSLGFQARLPTMLLTKPVDGSAADNIGVALWPSGDAGTQQRWLADLQEAAAQICPGLDYSKEIISSARHGLGETLVLIEGTKAIGSSTVSLVGCREGSGEECGSVQVLGLHPAHTDEETFRVLLESSQGLAHTHRKQVLTVWVNARHSWALEHLLASGYRVERAMLRMVLGETDDGPAVDGCVNLCRWAGYEESAARGPGRWRCALRHGPNLDIAGQVHDAHWSHYPS